MRTQHEYKLLGQGFIYGFVIGSCSFMVAAIVGGVIAYYFR